MRIKHSIFVTAIAAVLGAFTANSQTLIVSDNYNVTTSGTGFDLGSGVNTGIIPPTTRITGIASNDLRYIETVTTRPATKYDINSNRLRCSTDSGIGRFTISANGSTAFDFGPVLGATYASPTNKAVYDIKISMRNDATSTARFSFGIATAEGDVTTWDFGIQMYRSSGANAYTIQYRVDSASSGNGDINQPIGNTAPNTTNTMIAFLIRVTDAGAETTAYNSRVQVSMDNGATWAYDTDLDTAFLPNKFRFDGPGRVIVFDQAGNSSGNVFYDNFSITATTIPTAPPATVWTGAGANNNWSTPENWSAGVPVNGQPITFNGTSQQANANDLTGFDTPVLAFNNGGFSLAGNPFSVSSTISNVAGVNTLNGDLSFTSTGVKVWSIASGSQLVLNNNTAVEVNGDNNIIGGGSLLSRGAFNIGQASSANPAFAILEGRHIIDASAFTTRGGYRIGSQPSGAGAQTVITNGGSLSITATAGNMRVGDSANPNPARLDMDHGSVFLSGNAIFAVGYAAGANAVVNQNGGIISVPVVSFSESGAGTGSYTIKNGTLSTRVIRKNNSGGSASIYFDNATISSASSSSNLFLFGLDLAQIQAGGLVIDAQSDMTISQNLSGVGPLIKSNAFAVILTGTNTYAGNTTVMSGKLSLPTLQTNSGTVQVADGAELGVNERALGTTLNVAAVNFNGPSSGTLSFDLGTLSKPTAPLMKVANLSVNCDVTINIANGLQLQTGQIVLVDYDGTIGGGYRFNLGSLPPGVTATLVNNTANSSIDLNITGVPGFRWTGAVSGDWDTFTQNWVNQQDNSPSTYADGFSVDFRDGATTGNVNITGTMSPLIITVSNNTLPYVWSNGGVSVPTLKKFGAGSLTRTDVGADLIGSLELNEGTFAVSNSFESIFGIGLTDVSAGTGTFAKQGIGALNVSSTNSTYDGAVSIQQGTLRISNDRALGSTNARITIASGATLDLNNFVPGFQPVSVSGAGDGGVGAIIDSTTGAAVDTNLRDVTMLGDTTLGCPNGGRWDLRVRSGTGSGPGLKGNGFNLTKVGTGLVSIACQRNTVPLPYWNMNLGDVVINGGTLAFAESLTLGNPAKTITVNSGAILQLFDLNVTNPVVRNVFLNDGKITSGGGNTDTNVLNGTISTTGANIFNLDQGCMIVNGAVTGSGSVTVTANDPGRLYLNGVNTFTGGLTLSNGVTGGTGSISGNLVMLSGATLAPGQIDVVGTLSVGGNATLAGTTSMELNRSLSPNSDRLNVGGTLSFGGNLNVVLGVGAPPPQAGDVYQLFNKGSATSFSSVTLPNLSALPGNLSWNTSNLNANGSISVNGTVVSNPPTFTSVSVSGTNVILNGTGGTQGNNYILLRSMSLPTWTPIATNQFGAGGTFSITNGLAPNGPAAFFELQVP